MKIDTLRVEDICDFIGGSQPAKSEFIDEPKTGYVRLIQTRDYKTDSFPTYIPENSTRKFCDENDIMIGRYGSPVFQICRGLKGAYNVALLKAKPKADVDREFLYYFLKQDSVFQYVDKLSARTGGQTGVDLVSLNKYPVRIPNDTTDQRGLVASLVAIDKKIELNNRINSELEAMAKTIYDYWFVQFDFPDANGKPYKASGGKMVYNDALKREIPNGWHDGCTSEIISFNPTTYLSKGSLAKYIDMDSLPVKGFMTKRPRAKEFAGGTKFVKNDVAVARITPCLENGKTALLSRLEEGEVGFGSTEFIILRGKNFPLFGFASCLSRSESFRQFAIANMTGTSGRKRIDAKVLETYSLAIPPKDLLVKYEETVSSFFKNMTVNSIENDELSDLRDWLLPMLMNGQVTVNPSAELKNA